jgi:predicted lipid-binding transport protein (Tim44 family)
MADLTKRDQENRIAPHFWERHMAGGFFRGIVGGLLQLAGLGIFLIWLLNGAHGFIGFVIAMLLAGIGAFMTYVSRHTVRVRN